MPEDDEQWHPPSIPMLLAIPILLEASMRYKQIRLDEHTGMIGCPLITVQCLERAVKNRLGIKSRPSLMTAASEKDVVDPCKVLTCIGLVELLWRKTTGETLRVFMDVPIRIDPVRRQLFYLRSFFVCVKVARQDCWLDFELSDKGLKGGELACINTVRLVPCQMRGNKLDGTRVGFSNDGQSDAMFEDTVPW